ncbi:hypothetical protein [Brevibacillus reuszeri]|uniref:hypothetical protein n=1 Tax=Brevibacillus reuszeri TaxID=54915 RepID=UPI000CCC96D5|nr:hypothetical protein [Brevibacillus reuszeri]
MTIKKSKWKRFCVSMLNIPLALMRKKLVSPAQLMRDRGPLVIDTATPESLLAGATRQWKRLHDTEFQIREAEELVDRMNNQVSR